MPLLARLLRRFRRPGPSETAIPAEQPLRNYSEALIRAEFKRRYLVEFAGYVGRDRVASQAAGANFLMLAMFLGGAAIAGPIAGLIGSGFALRQVWAAHAAKPGLQRATARIAKRLQDDEGSPASVENWLDRHMEVLPTYLDRLDREEAAERRERVLIDRINRRGTADDLNAEDRAFLKARGIRKLRSPLRRRFPLPPRVGIGNWHHSQLARALWREIGRETE
jgi:hypothetical protein